MILTGVTREPQQNSSPNGESIVPKSPAQDARSGIGATKVSIPRMYHHHPYSYHRAFSIAANRQPSYNFTYATAPQNHTPLMVQQQPSHQQSHQIPDARSQNQSQNHIVPVHALNQNSNISAASYSTGEKTSSSQALTQQSSATTAATGSGVGYSFISPNINRNLCSTSSPYDNNNTNNTITTTTTAAAANTNTCTNNSISGNNNNSNNNSSSISISTSGGTTNLPTALNNRKCMATTSSTSSTNNTKKLKTEPVLTQFFQVERFTFANTYFRWSEDNWKRVVFQDERKFNLDGPDGFSYYFHDLRNYERTLSQRPRGNSVYIYLIITAGGPIQIEISNAKCKLQKSIETILRERSAIISKLNGDTEFILQDHNWIGNALPTAQEWLSTEGIKTQKWPTVAHDINIMENVWGWLIREVFDGGRKFSRKDDLIFRIRESWSRLPIDLITNLYSTLPERIMELNYTRGIYTNC